MSEYENVFRRRELHDMFASGEVKPLDDLYLVEDAALTVKELNEKLAFYKEYKKRKSQDINDEIKVITNKVDFFKAVIASTLKSNNQKSVKFPGSCIASSRNAQAKWRIDDEEEFIAVLQEAQKAGEDVGDVLEKVVQFNIRKREANKLLNIWESSGKLDGFLSKAKKGVGDIVVKEPPKITVALKFLEEEEEEEEVMDAPIPVKAQNVVPSIAEYDTLSEIG